MSVSQIKYRAYENKWATTNFYIGTPPEPPKKMTPNEIRKFDSFDSQKKKLKILRGKQISKCEPFNELFSTTL